MYWICGNRKDRKICDLPTYKTEELDLFVLESIKLALAHELNAIKEFCAAGTLKQPKPVTRSVDAEKAAIRLKMERLAAEYADGYVEQDAYRNLISRYKASLGELDKIGQEEPEQVRPRITAAEIFEFRHSFAEAWKTVSEAERRELISRVVKNILVYPDKLIVRTLLTLGDITIPTMMFEQVEIDSHLRADLVSESALRRGAPDRIIGGHMPGCRYVLSDIGRNLRFKGILPVFADHVNGTICF